MHTNTSVNSVNETVISNLIFHCNNRDGTYTQNVILVWNSNIATLVSLLNSHLWIATSILRGPQNFELSSAKSKWVFGNGYQPSHGI